MMMARRYYYDTGEEKIGPVTGNELVQLRAAGKVQDDTWVRREHSGTWRHLAGIDLKAEEEEEAHPSLWKLLLRQFSVWNLLLAAAVLVVLILLVIGMLRVLWPLILALVVLWFLSRLLRV